MCNEAARLRSLGEISAEFSRLKIPLRFPEGLPNLGEAPSIRITDPTAIVRTSRDGIVRAAGGDRGGDGAAHPAIPTGPAREREGSGADLVVRRWSWPGPTGKPVYNFRSEGRTFANAPTGGRCLIPLDAFFEFTDPPAGAPKPKRKDKWRFTAADGGLLGVAGIWRAGVVPAEGRADVAPGADGAARGSEAFTMLTCAPGPDVAPYHSRQIVLIPRDRWADWLGVGDRGLVPAAELIAPAAAGTLVVARAR